MRKSVLLCALITGLTAAAGTAFGQTWEPTITSVYGTGDGNSTSAMGGIAVTVDGDTVPSGATHMKICSLEEGANAWQVRTRTLNADHYYHLANRKRGYRHRFRVDTEPNAELCDDMGGEVWGAARPAPVSNVGTSNISNTSITLTWTKPSDHPDASWETGYNTNTNADEPLDSTISFTTGSSQAMTGLSAGTEYKLFVRTVVRRNNETLDNAISAWRSTTAETTGGTWEPVITSVYGSGDGDDTFPTGGISVTVDGDTVPDGATQIKICSQEEGSDLYQVLHQNLNADYWWHLAARKRGYRYRVVVDSEPNAVQCDNMGGEMWGTPRPAPVSNAATSNITNTSITLTWTKPNDHRDASWETGYNTNTNADEPLDSTISFTTGSSQAMTGLSAGTEYKLFVRTVVRRNGETLDNATSTWRSAVGQTTGGDWTPEITSVYGSGDGNDTFPTGGISVTVDGDTIPSGATQVKICSLEEGSAQYQVLHQNLNNDYWWHLAARKRGYRYRVTVDSEPNAVQCDYMGGEVWGSPRPAPVSNVSTSNISNTSITLTWTNPEDHRDASWETGYNTNVNASDPIESTIGNFTTGSSQTITGLSASTEYRLFVRTVTRRNGETLDNSISTWRSVTARTTGGDGTLPGRPQNLTIAQGEGHLTATWDPAPTDSSRPITQQRFNWYPASENPWDPSSERISLPADATTHTVTDLPCGVPYILRVRARNSAGWGDWASAESFASGPPSHPQNGVLNPYPDSISVTWDAPERSCGSDISSYQVGYKVEDSDMTMTPFAGTGTRYTIEDLQHSTEHEVFVRANNDWGSGPWWSQKTMTAAPPDNPDEPERPEPPTGVPSAPRELVLAPGNANIFAGWQIPASTGDSPIENYRIQYMRSGESWQTPIDTPDETLYHILVNLTNDITHFVRVAAMNEQGVGPWSDIKSATPTERPRRVPRVGEQPGDPKSTDGTEPGTSPPGAPPDGGTPGESNLQPVPALPAWALGALVALLFGRALRLRRR